MKKLLLISAVLSLNIAHAETETISPYPGAKPGINIWPMAKINPGYTSPPLNKDGFIETKETDSNVELLLNLPKTAKKVVAQYDKVTDVADTNLKSSISKLHLDFNFKGIPSISESDVLGYAVAGGYTAKGWNSAVEFAAIKDLGVCSFAMLKIESVILAKETVTYLVNGKPTEKYVLGNYTGGFNYDVIWYANSRRYAFECATTKYDAKIIDKMVAVSKEIDRVNEG